MRIFTRASQTLRNRTNFVDRIYLPELQRVLLILELKERVEKRHFILIFEDVLAGKRIWEDIKIVGEVASLYDRERCGFRKPVFTISPTEQYPEFTDFINDFEVLVRSKIVTHINQRSL